MFLTYYVIHLVCLQFYLILSVVYFLPQHQLLRAFDHICMEKAYYKFLIIIITDLHVNSPLALLIDRTSESTHYKYHY